jgi:hypothetical protein
MRKESTEQPLTRLVSIVGSVIAVSFVMARQAAWLEAIEKRISVTSQMIGSMKGVKMCGLTDVLSTRIHALRNDELRISGKFRRLLIWNMVLGEYLPSMYQTASVERLLTRHL